MSVNTKEELLTPEQLEAMMQKFPIASLTRADLVQDGYDRNAVLALTDDDMRAFAELMFNEDAFWDDIQDVGDNVFKLKRTQENNED